jgi:hypothetical protein
MELVDPRVPYYLENRLTDGGQIVSRTRNPLFTLGRSLVLIFYRQSTPQGHGAAGRIR